MNRNQVWEMEFNDLAKNVSPDLKINYFNIKYDDLKFWHGIIVFNREITREEKLLFVEKLSKTRLFNNIDLDNRLFDNKKLCLFDFTRYYTVEQTAKSYVFKVF